MAQSEIAPGRRKLISTDRLRKVDFLQGLAEGELRSIAHFFEEENVGAGVSLCEEGARAERLYVVEQGRISISSKNGQQYYIYTPGKTVGWSFLVPPFLYTASAVTTAPSKFLVIKSPDFYDFIHEGSQMEMKVLSNLAQVIASRLRGA
jgi:CRP-like cAMP-binding protein